MRREAPNAPGIDDFYRTKGRLRVIKRKLNLWERIFVFFIYVSTLPRDESYFCCNERGLNYGYRAFVVLMAGGAKQECKRLLNRIFFYCDIF
ncbi:MAG: hypothetical protein AABX73_02350 [Nanoarchaeota archaeon]